MYRAIVLVTLLYSSKSWVTYRHHLKFLEWFHECCLCTILNISWCDFISIEVLEKANTSSIKVMLLKCQLRWAGYISRNHPLPRIILGHKLSSGHHDRGAPKKGFKDCLKKSFGAYHINHCWCSTLADNHDTWCLLLWKHFKGHSQREKAQVEGLQYFSINIWIDLLL